MNTDETTPHRDLPEPPFSTRLLADLHAGALDAETAAHVHRHLAGDADSARILAALDATTADLAALRDEEIEPPAAIADRLDDVVRGLSGH